MSDEVYPHKRSSSSEKILSERFLRGKKSWSKRKNFSCV